MADPDAAMNDFVQGFITFPDAPGPLSADVATTFLQTHPEIKRSIQKLMHLKVYKEFEKVKQVLNAKLTDSENARQKDVDRIKLLEAKVQALEEERAAAVEKQTEMDCALRVMQGVAETAVAEAKSHEKKSEISATTADSEHSAETTEAANVEKEENIQLKAALNKALHDLTLMTEERDDWHEGWRVVLEKSETTFERRFEEETRFRAQREAHRQQMADIEARWVQATSRPYGAQNAARGGSDTRPTVRRFPNQRQF